MKLSNRSSLIALAAVASVAALTQTANARPTVYDSTNNFTATPFAGYGQALANNPIYGDNVTLSSTGTLSNFSLSIWNGDATATNTISGGTVAVRFYLNNGSLPSASTLIGGFNGNFTFTTPLSGGGGYGFLTYSNLETLATPIVFNSTSIYVTQQFTALTGASGTVGVVAYNTAPTIGSSTNTFYLTSSTTTAGAYTLGSQTTNIPYVIGTTSAVVPEASSVALVGAAIAPLLGIVAARRRKKA